MASDKAGIDILWGLISYTESDTIPAMAKVFLSASHNQAFSKAVAVRLMNGPLEEHGSNQEGKDCWRGGLARCKQCYVLGSLQERLGIDTTTYTAYPSSAPIPVLPLQKAWF